MAMVSILASQVADLPGLIHSESSEEDFVSMEDKKTDSTCNNTDPTTDCFDYDDESDYDVEILPLGDDGVEESLSSQSNNASFPAQEPAIGSEMSAEVEDVMKNFGANRYDDDSSAGTLSLNDAFSMTSRNKDVMGGFSNSIRDGFCALSISDFESVASNEFDLRSVGTEEDFEGEARPSNPRRRLSMIMRGQIENEDEIANIEEEASTLSTVTINEAEIEALADKRGWEKLQNTAIGISSYKSGKCRLNFYLSSSTVSCFWMDRRKGFKEIFRCSFDLNQVDSLFENDGKQKFYPKFPAHDNSSVQLNPNAQGYNGTGYQYSHSRVVSPNNWVPQSNGYGVPPQYFNVSQAYHGQGHGRTSRKGKKEQKPNCRYGALCKRPNCWFQHPSIRTQQSRENSGGG